MSVKLCEKGIIPVLLNFFLICRTCKLNPPPVKKVESKVFKAKQLKLADFLLQDEVFHIARITHETSNSLVHTHDFYELFWIEAGHGFHHINSEKVALKSGDLVMIRPTDVHKFSCRLKNPLVMVNVAFSKKTVAFIRRRYFSDSKLFFWCSEKLPYQVSLSSLKRVWLKDAVETVIQSPKVQLTLEGFLLQLFGQVLQSQDVETPACPDWLAYAASQYNQPKYFAMGVEGFVELAGRCSEHVNRQVRLHFDMTTSQMVNRARMAYAQKQLAMSNQTIMDISLDCGIENLGHFYKLFKRHFAMTPKAYRQNMRGIA